MAAPQLPRRRPAGTAAPSPQGSSASGDGSNTGIRCTGLSCGYCPVIAPGSSSLPSHATGWKWCNSRGRGAPDTQSLLRGLYTSTAAMPRPPSSTRCLPTAANPASCRLCSRPRLGTTSVHRVAVLDAATGSDSASGGGCSHSHSVVAISATGSAARQAQHPRAITVPG